MQACEIIHVDPHTKGVYSSCMKRMNMHLTERQIERLEALKERTGLSKSEHNRRALDLYLEKMERF